MVKKHFTLALVSFLFLTAMAAETQEPKEYYGQEAEKICSYATHVWVKDAHRVPDFIEFKPNVQIDELNFLSILKKTFNLPMSYSAVQIGLEKDEIGWEHIRYQLTVSGVPAGDCIFILHTKKGKVLKYNGYIPLSITTPSSPPLSESVALNLALQNIHASTYKWQANGEEEHLKAKTHNQIGRAHV